MLFYSIFPSQKLCIFHVGETLTHAEMLECYEDLKVDSRWDGVDTVLADLRDCVDVDVSFVEDSGRVRMENKVFGFRKVIWLTGHSTVLGKLSMAEVSGGQSSLERYQFENSRELERYFGDEGHELLECLLSLE